MSHSTHVGFREPLIYCPSRFARALLLLPPAFDAPFERAVGHSFTAIASGVPIPLPFFFSALIRSRRASHVAGCSPSCITLASGVGHSARQPGCFCIDGHN